MAKIEVGKSYQHTPDHVVIGPCVAVNETFWWDGGTHVYAVHDDWVEYVEPPALPVGFVNIYDDVVGNQVHATREDADIAAGKEFHKRIGVLQFRTGGFEQYPYIHRVDS